MGFISIRGAVMASVITMACGAASAFPVKGNYDVTFTSAGGGQVQYCVTLASQGASGPYGDVGTATFYTGGSPVGTGTYVLFQKTLSVAITNSKNTEYLTASGTFAATQAFNTAVIDLTSSATILATATFSYVRDHTPCATVSD